MDRWPCLHFALWHLLTLVCIQVSKGTGVPSTVVAMSYTIAGSPLWQVIGRAQMTWRLCVLWECCVISLQQTTNPAGNAVLVVVVQTYH